MGQHSYCVSTKTHYTYTQNMLRFVIGALLLSTTVLGAVQPRVQPNARQFEPQQSELGEWKTVEPQQTEFGEWKIEPQQTEFGEWKVVSQGDNVQGREEFGGNVDLTTPFGGAVSMLLLSSHFSKQTKLLQQSNVLYQNGLNAKLRTCW